MADATPFHSGYVALVGLPNAGKSTLLNRLLDFHLSAVAPRPQTTRHRIQGILNGPRYQAVFLDTPGLLTPRYALQRVMRGEIDSALGDADVLVLVVDGSGPADGLDGLCAVAAGRRVIAAINKIDRVRHRESLLGLAQLLAARGISDVYMVSALKGSRIEDLKRGIVAALPEGQPYYPPGQLTERPERFFVAEFVREAIFNLYGEEIPYSTAVETEEFRERPGRKDFIAATIHVEREGQKGILIGKDGAALKRVGSQARRRIEHFLGRPVFLELRVKVASDWRESEGFIRSNVYGR